MSEEIEAVVLAAGLSSRSERYKMTLPLGNSTVIERSIAGMYALASRILVVVGWQAETVQTLLASYDKVECVLNREYSEGMFSSVRAGISQIRGSRFFLQPGDIPLVSATVYQQLLTTPPSQDIVIPTFEGRKGHPILMSSRLIPEILSAPATATLRDIVTRYGFTPLPVDDEAILWDIDTLADYNQLQERQRSRINDVI